MRSRLSMSARADVPLSFRRRERPDLQRVKRVVLPPKTQGLIHAPVAFRQGETLKGFRDHPDRRVSAPARRTGRKMTRVAAGFIADGDLGRAERFFEPEPPPLDRVGRNHILERANATASMIRA